MKRKLIALSYASFAAVAVTAAALAPNGPTYDLSWWTVDAGGGTSAGGIYEVTGTIGQHDADDVASTGGVYELNGGFWHLGAMALSETICPEAADDFEVNGFIGGTVFGDALDACASDDSYLQQANALPVSPLFPYAQIDIWSTTSFGPGSVSSIDYNIEWALTALVPGGQNPDAMRTRIRRYTGGPSYETVDVRPGAGFTDLFISHTQSTNVTDYIQAGDGEIRVQVQGFAPGNALNANWVVRIDELSMTVNQ